MGNPSSLICSRCREPLPANQIANLCACGGPLLVEYDLQSIARNWHRSDLQTASASMWRYAPVLPADLADAVTRNEGWTPLLLAGALGGELGIEKLWIKDEGRNPTGSFKARGLACAVTMLRKFGVTTVAIPSAGNAGGALAAYASLAGMHAHVYMPSDVPQSNFLEASAHGASVKLIRGLISDCGRMVAEDSKRHGWFDISTLKEPYRIEGKKTMGYEIAEQLGWRMPDAIVYPCGGGVGLIGIWKAVRELEELGWISGRRPRMICVQAAGCAPVVTAFHEGRDLVDLWPEAHTVASGLRVPKPLGDALVLQAVRESGGTAIAVSDEEMLDSALQLARTEGLFAAPETGACLAAVSKLKGSGELKSTDETVVISTGSGFKYSEAFSTRLRRQTATEQDKLGGLITPR